MAPTTALPVVLIAVRRERSIAPLLEPNGYFVVQASTGARAIERARETRPDVIILDADLPDMLGIDVCGAVRRDPLVGRHVPILILAADKPTPEQRVTAIRAGVWDFLPYPIEQDDLALKLEAYVQAKRSIDAALADGMIDPVTGLHSRSGLARRARELGALMARHHGGLACVVFAVEGQPADPRAANLVAHTARVCDVVGALGPSEFAVLAPATDDAGAVKLVRPVRDAGGGAWAGHPGSVSPGRLRCCGQPEVRAHRSRSAPRACGRGAAQRQAGTRLSLGAPLRRRCRVGRRHSRRALHAARTGARRLEGKMMQRTRLLRAALLGAGAVLLLSCADPSPLGVDPRAGLFGLPDLTPPPVGLLQCTPLAYDSVTQTVGPEGGTLAVGPHTLSIPAGALDTAVSITAVAPPDTVNAVRFAPEGLTFQEPVLLTMSYANCDLLGSLLPKRIAYTTDALQILEYLASVDETWTQTVTGQLQHFSEYAIAW
jgi:CheY-like chemotaxis protein